MYMLIFAFKKPTLASNYLADTAPLLSGRSVRGTAEAEGGGGGGSSSEG